MLQEKNASKIQTWDSSDRWHSTATIPSLGGMSLRTKANKDVCIRLKAVLRQLALSGVLQQDVFNGKYHSGKTNSFHGEITLFVGWGFFKLFLFSLEKAAHFGNISY